MFFLAAAPEVSVTADRPGVDLLNTATLNCTVTSGNPKIYNYTWFYEGALLPFETSSILTGIDEVGTYTCEVTNEVGVGMASIFIGLEGERCNLTNWQLIVMAPYFAYSVYILTICLILTIHTRRLRVPNICVLNL